jgi:hypothetical protein
MVEGICHLDRENIEEYRVEEGCDFLPATDLLPAANIPFPAVKLMARSIFARFPRVTSQKQWANKSRKKEGIKPSGNGGLGARGTVRRQPFLMEKWRIKS